MKQTRNVTTKGDRSDQQVPPMMPDGDTPDWLAEAKRIADLYEPPAVGRPSDALTDVPRLYRLLKLVAEGNYIDVAVRAAGIARRTYYNWRTMAEKGNVAAMAAVDALERAQAQAECDDAEVVRKAGLAGPQYWPAAMTRLERRYPDRWGRRPEDTSAPRVIVQIGVRDGDVKVTCSAEDLAAVLAEPQTPAPSVDLPASPGDDGALVGTQRVVS